MPHGYSIIGARLHQALQAAGAEVLDPTAYGWDCVVCIALPAAWVSPPATRRVDLVWHTMFECTPLPQDWVEPLNRCGLVWAPSPWVADLFRDAGVTTPIITSGYGVDPAIFWPQRRQAGERFRILVWGTGLVGRKNVLTALRVFIAAGLADSELEIKINAGMGADVKRDGSTLSNVRIIAADWPYQSQLADWLRTGDCLLYLSGGEGFGLMPLEAMATGMPVVLAANTGMLTYAHAHNAFLVECPRLVQSAEYNTRFRGTYWLYEPDFDAAVAQLRYIYKHRDVAYERGMAAAREVHAGWTWQQAGQRALSELQRFYGG